MPKMVNMPFGCVCFDKRCCEGLLAAPSGQGRLHRISRYPPSNPFKRPLSSPPKMWRTRCKSSSSVSSQALPLWRCCCLGLVLSLATAASASSVPTAEGLSKRQLSPALGISNNNLDKNGIAVGKIISTALQVSSCTVEVLIARHAVLEQQASYQLGGFLVYLFGHVRSGIR